MSPEATVSPRCTGPILASRAGVRFGKTIDRLATKLEAGARLDTVCERSTCAAPGGCRYFEVTSPERRCEVHERKDTGPTARLCSRFFFDLSDLVDGATVVSG